MKRLVLVATTVALTLVGAAQASAASITSFARGVNDGVFTLNQAQKDYFGVAGAEYLAFFRPRFSGSLTGTIGDTFNAQTILDSVTGDTNILAILNGNNSGINYTGDYLTPLGTATLTAAQNNYFQGVAFLMKSGGVVNFSGGNISAGNGPQLRGGLDYIPPATVPLPAAAWCLLAGLGLLGAIARRRRSA